jgi:hypothetical protein
MDEWTPYRPSVALPGTEERWEAYASMRDPYDRAIHYLRLGRVDYLDDALDFLERRPRFLQSGYLTERMLRFLTRPVLNEQQRSRVVGVAERIAGEGYTREAWEAKRLLVRLGVPGWSAVRVTRITAFECDLALD